MGSADRIIRVGQAIFIVVLYFTHPITGTLASITSSLDKAVRILKKSRRCLV